MWSCVWTRTRPCLSCQPSWFHSQEFSFTLQLFVSFLPLRGLLPSNASISAIRGAVSWVRTWDRDRKSEVCDIHQVQVDDKSTKLRTEFLSTNAKSDFLSILWGSRGSPAADLCWTHRGGPSWHLHYEDTTLRDTHKQTDTKRQRGRLCFTTEKNRFLFCNTNNLINRRQGVSKKHTSCHLQPRVPIASWAAVHFSLSASRWTSLILLSCFFPSSLVRRSFSHA